MSVLHAPSSLTVKNIHNKKKLIFISKHLSELLSDVKFRTLGNIIVLYTF